MESNASGFHWFILTDTMVEQSYRTSQDGGRKVSLPDNANTHVPIPSFWPRAQRDRGSGSYPYTLLQYGWNLQHVLINIKLLYLTSLYNNSYNVATLPETYHCT